MLVGIAAAPVAAQIPATPAVQPVAILTVLSGDVLMRNATGDFRSAMDGTVLHVGSMLRTSTDARALITLFDGSTVELDPASDVTIHDTSARSGSTFLQSLGRGLQVVMHLTTADSRYERTKPAATASVRGIDFQIGVAADRGSLSTTLMPTAHLVSAPVAISASVHVLAPTETITARATSETFSERSASRGERARRALAKMLSPRAPSDERSRNGDETDDREEDDRQED
jgi:hypothetical protein